MASQSTSHANGAETGASSQDHEEELILTKEDGEEVHDDGDAPMDDDDDNDDEDEVDDEITPMRDEGDEGDLDSASHSQGINTEFQDTSLAAFYSHRDSLFTVALHPQYPNPPLALSGGADDKGWLWNTQDGSDVAQLGGHTDSVISVGWNAAGNMVATGGMDGNVRVWRRKGDDWKQWDFVTNLEGPDDVVWIQWHPKGDVLIAGAADSTLWMWKLPKGDVMQVFSGHTGPVTCGTFTPDGRRIVTASEDGTLIFWDPNSTSAIAKLSPYDARFQLDGGITSLCVASDNRVLVVGGANGDVRVVNLANADSGSLAVVAELRGHRAGESVEALQFVDLLGGTSPSASATATPVRPPTTLISAATDNRAIVWDLASSKPRCEVVHDAPLTGLAVHASSHLFTTSSADHTLRTWDARTGACLATHRGFTDGVLGLAVGPDDGFTQGAQTGGLGAYVDPNASTKGWKIIGAGDEGVGLVFRV